MMKAEIRGRIDSHGTPKIAGNHQKPGRGPGQTPLAASEGTDLPTPRSQTSGLRTETVNACGGTVCGTWSSSGYNCLRQMRGRQLE